MAVIPIGMIDPVLQFLDGNGKPYAAGSVTFYISGTMTLKNVFSDVGLSVILPNPLPLNAAGRSSTSTTGPVTPVYFSAAPYDYVLKDANGLTVYGPEEFTGGSVTGTNWLTSTPQTANYSAVAGDLVNATANSFNVTIPVAASNVSATIGIVNSGTGVITLIRSGSDTIGLATSQTLKPSGSSGVQGDAMVLISDGISNWLITGQVKGLFRASAFNSTTQTLTTATQTALTLDSEDYDVGNMHSVSVNTSRMTIPAGGAGTYLINALSSYAANASGARVLSLYKNGSLLTKGASFTPINGASTLTGVAATAMAVLAAGDYIEAFGYQDTGGNLAFGSAATGDASRLQITQIA